MEFVELEHWLRRSTYRLNDVSWIMSINLPLKLKNHIYYMHYRFFRNKVTKSIRQAVYQ